MLTNKDGERQLFFSGEGNVLVTLFWKTKQKIPDQQHADLVLCNFLIEMVVLCP